MPRLAWSAALVVATVAAGCTSSPSPSSPSVVGETPPIDGRPCRGGPAPTTYRHVVWIWMENHSHVLDSPAAPFERALGAACSVGSSDAAVGSPSLPNYLAATSGSTWGIGDDAGPGSHRLTADNIFREVRATHRTARSYEENMAVPCQPSSAGEYAVKHNPAAYYIGGDDRAACATDDIALGALTSGALAHDIDAGTLPAFAFITPNLCNDTHDCGVGTGDRWLGQWLPRILAGSNYAAGDTAVFVAWDEPTPMSQLVIAPSVRPGTVVSARTDHYGLLRATEELLGLPLLAHASSAVDLRGLYGI